MRIDLPTCGFKSCRYCFDGNCTNKVEYDRCEYREYKDFLQVHGHWIEYQIPHIICCSNCDWATDVVEKNFQYCPMCGTQMDGGVMVMRLIDADTLMDVIRQHEYRLATKQGSIDYGMFTLGIQQAVDEQPTVDAVEVVHGRWRCHGDCGVTECSVCGWSIEEYVGDYAYCPNCGARMEGGTN